MEIRRAKLLSALHHLRLATVSALNKMTGIRTQTISAWLKELEAEGWIHSLGYANTDPATGLAGQWWHPSRKNVKGVVWKDAFQANVKVLTEGQAEKTRTIQFGKSFIKRHELEASVIIATASQCMRECKLPGKLESETYLRQVRKWCGNPRNAEQHAATYLVSVPDARISAGAWSLSIECESTVKGVESYRRYVEHAEPGADVLWIVRHDRAADHLLALLDYAGNGAAKGHTVAVQDLAYEAIKACITAASAERSALS